MILFLCFVGTVLHVISDCMKPTTDSPLSKNDSFMPVKRGHVEYESSLVDSPETSATHLNSTQSCRSGSSIPLLVYDKHEGMECSLSQIVKLLYTCFKIYLYLLCHPLNSFELSMQKQD